MGSLPSSSTQEKNTFSGFPFRTFPLKLSRIYHKKNYTHLRYKFSLIKLFFQNRFVKGLIDIICQQIILL